jgi:hypothetical protein
MQGEVIMKAIVMGLVALALFSTGAQARDDD